MWRLGDDLCSGVATNFAQQPPPSMPLSAVIGRIPPAADRKWRVVKSAVIREELMNGVNAFG